MGALFGVYVTKAPLTEDVRILNIKSMKETRSGHTCSRELKMQQLSDGNSLYALSDYGRTNMETLANQL